MTTPRPDFRILTVLDAILQLLNPVHSLLKPDDGAGASKRRRTSLLCLEQLEVRITPTAGGTGFELPLIQTPQIVLNSVSTTDSNELTVNYNINTANLLNEGVHSFDIGIFRSDKPTYDATDTNNVEVASYDLTGKQLNPGSNQTITINSSNGVWAMNTNKLVSPLVPDPQLPYVLAVIDPQNQLPSGVTKDSTQADFRIYTIVAVTHGQEFSNSGADSAPWVGQIVAGLQKEYNAVTPSSGFVFPIYWDSFPPAAGQTQAAGNSMYNQIVAAADSVSGLQPNDIIDVQFIGHSRGASVIGQAMQDLVTLLPNNPHLQHGYYEMTFLDPHPANNGTIGDVSLASLTALAKVSSLAEYLGVVVDLTYILASEAADDPSISVPSRINQVQVYYQNNPAIPLVDISLASLENSPWEAVFNLWGVPSQITIANSAATLVNTVNISSLGVGHGEVPLWYLTNLAQLTNGGPPPSPLPSFSAQLLPSVPASPNTDPNPDQLLVIPVSLDAASGAATKVYVVAVNSEGNVDANFNGLITLSLQNGNGAALGGTLHVNAQAGLAVFTDVRINTPGDGYVLQASSDTADSGTSPDLDVFTDQLAITTGPPSSVTVGSSDPIVVEAQNGSGKVDASFNGQVTVTVANPFDDAQDTTVTLNAVNGKASGTLKFTNPGEFIVTASSDGVANVFSFVDVKPLSNLPTPSFSNVSAPVITVGSGTTTISGKLQANGGQQTVPTGESVQITLNGLTQNATLAADDSFSTTFATGSLSISGSPYTIGFSYAGDGTFGPTSATSALTVLPFHPSPPPPPPPPTVKPPQPPQLSVPTLLALFDQLLAATQTVNADGSVTETANLFGIPLLVSRFDSSGKLESVMLFGINVTSLFELF